MSRNIHRKFIAVVISVSVAITAFSANSAIAGERDAARFLAGVAGLVILGAILEDQRRDNKSTGYVSRNRYEPAPRAYRNPNSRLKPRPLPKRVARKILPAECVRDFNSRRGAVRMVGNRCLENNYRYVNRLPNDCYREVRTRRGVRSGYGVRCLRNSGYTFARN